MDHNEINLKEMLSLLWKGRYLIAGVTAGFIVLGIIFSFVIVPTSYESSVYLNPSVYHISRADLLVEADRMNVVERVAAELAKQPRLMIKGTKIQERMETQYIKVTVNYQEEDNQVTYTAAEKIGLWMLQLAREHYERRLKMEKEGLERLLVNIDEELAAYRDDPAPIGQSHETLIILEMDPVKKQLLERKGEKMIALQSVDFALQELATNPGLEPREWLFPEADPVTAKPVNKPVYITLTAFLGLALSCFVVLVRQSFREPGSAVEHNQAG